MIASTFNDVLAAICIVVVTVVGIVVCAAVGMWRNPNIATPPVDPDEVDANLRRLGVVNSRLYPQAPRRPSPVGVMSYAPPGARPVPPPPIPLPRPQ